MALGERSGKPLRWRSGPPPVVSRGTLFQFVREFLCRNAGTASRGALHGAMLGDRRIADRLDRSQGFDRILWNMRTSGWIEIEGDRITASRKTIRKMRGLRGGD